MRQGLRLRQGVHLPGSARRALPESLHNPQYRLAIDLHLSANVTE